MTESGMKANAKKMNADDTARMLSAFQDYKASQSALAELEQKLDTLKKDAAEKEAALDEAMEAGKVNAMSESIRNEYEAARAAVAEIEEKLAAWMEKNGRTRPTPELIEEYDALNKSLQEAIYRVGRFDI